MNGNWQTVTLLEKESEYLYRVHYKGASDSADEWLSVNQLKNIDTSAHIFLPKEKAEINSTSSLNCSFTPPVGMISNSEVFSEKVAKRKIYELLISKNKPATRLGVGFLFLQIGQPYTNSVSVSANGSLVYKNASAPAGAMIYPIKTKVRICEKSGSTITSKIVDDSFSCYRNSKGLWQSSNN